MSWVADVSRYKSRSGNNPSTCHSGEQDFVDSLVLMKFYSMSTSIIRHLLSGCDGNEMDIPFELTDEQMEIIRFNRSSFILARSGTGKTADLIMKLLRKEQLHHLSLEGFHEVECNSSMSVSLRKETDGCILRQIFVTSNARLCLFVKQSTCGWNSSAESSDHEEEDFDEILEFSDIPDSFSDLPQSSYPLVISFNKFLMMLNGTVGRSFFEKFPELRGLCEGKRKASKSMVLKTFIITRVVSYEKFCSSYWHYFSPLHTKKFDPSSVFAEIISHIKGGSRIGVNDDILSREDYITYSLRRLSALSQQDRGRIYDIFLEYERTKKRNGEFDMFDLVIDLHHWLRDETYEGEKMDYVYIDEVQDLTMRQISLFKYICKNFEEGFVVSGDTAQTIVRGVDFRFEDIRALFYTEFLCERKQKGKIADIFHLSQNFRTHAGVLKLANSVVELLYHFFPSSIDQLIPQTNHVKGEQPVWIQTKENALGSLFRSSGSNYLEFGAEQAILVRDEIDKNKIFNLVGEKAIVLTVMECKGLEFQDVLLYNFFSSSPLNYQWDVIYGYMKEQGLLVPPHPKSFPTFDEGKHTALCFELKQLYVAITRTRQRLWIFENVSSPVFNYWLKLQLVHVRELDDKFLEEIQVTSSQEEWKARGIKFFHQMNYDQARFCFERAGESYWEKWAVAAGHRCTADNLRVSDPIIARVHLTQGAHMFESIGKNESAVQCFFELKEYEKAGIIYLEKFGESRMEEAGECFHLAGCYKKAAEIYAKCNLFSKCSTVCDDGKLFETGYKYFQLWKENNCIIEQEIASKEVQRFFEKGALHFNKLKDSKTMMKFVKALQYKNLMRTFLKNADCLDELLLLEKEWRKFSEAANIANMKGDVLLEADLLQMAQLFEKASTVILFYVFYNSLWVQKSKGWSLNNFAKKEELLEKAKTFAKNASSDFHGFICMEANILSHEQLLECFLEEWKSERYDVMCSKILDVYLPLSRSKHMFEGDLIKCAQSNKSWEQTSVENLLYYWDFWNEEIEKMLWFVQAWVKGINLRNIKRNGNLIWIDADQFVRAATTYWSSERLTVGVKVSKSLTESKFMNDSGTEFSIPDAIFLNLNVEQHRGSILRALRLKNHLVSSNWTHHRYARTESFGRGQYQGLLSTSSFVSIIEQTKFQNEDRVREANLSNRQFWLMLESLDFEGIYEAKFQVDIPLFKEVVLQYILVANAAMRKCCQSNFVEDCEVPSDELNNALDELQQLYSALSSSELVFEDVKEIQNIVKKLGPRRERMEPLVEKLLMCDKEAQEKMEPCTSTEAESNKDGADSSAEKRSSEVEASNTTVSKTTETMEFPS
ncbi:conserved hypothetical protein [Ricinus communis]|uniref:UvrD-like helicase ATP-binding domain-containing protein n=1 Tax=Ricinus communis TaxID=3988 RepID=B9SBW9_RICCO|nr:conserved hypothetical protein [Ricinus communis]